MLEARKLEVEIRKLDAEATKADAEAWEAVRKRGDQAASSNAHRTYHFVGEVREGSVKDCIQALDMWSRRDPGEPITLIINSPGGDVIDGLALYDFIVSDLRSDRGHEVTTVTRGYAASMGGVLLQAGSNRLIAPNAYVLIHEVSRGAIGKVSELEDVMDFTKRLQDRLAEILALRSKLDADEVRERWSRKDWWLDADEVVELGFADRVG